MHWETQAQCPGPRQSVIYNTTPAIGNYHSNCECTCVYVAQVHSLPKLSFWLHLFFPSLLGFPARDNSS